MQVNANYQVGLDELVWEPGTTRPVLALSGVTNSFISQNLLSNDTYGEGIRIVDLKLGKNIRFRNKRINVGAEVFNVFNSDAALGHCATYPNPAQGTEGCNIGNGVISPWRAVTNITTPRYVRFQLQVDF